MVIYSNMGLGIALAALLVALTNIIFTLMDGHTGKPQNRIYITILGVIAVNSICEMVNSIAKENAAFSDTAFLALRVSQYIYFLSHTLLAPMFFFYISLVVGRSVGGRISRKYSGSTVNFLLDIIPLSTVILMELFLAINPIMHWAWYYDENRQFHRAWGEYAIVYALSALWIIASFVLVMHSWSILSKGRKRSIAICFLLVEIGVIVQLFSSAFRIEVLMEALGFTGVMLFIENEDDRKNVELQVYNAAAFSLDLAATIRNKIPVQVIVVRSIHFDKTGNKMVSSRIDRESISYAVSQFLSTKIKWYFIYAIGHGRFALTVFNRSAEEANQLAREIEARFKAPWEIEETDVFLTSRIMIIRVPENARTTDEVRYIAECPIPDRIQHRILENDDLDWILRHAAVENAVTRGLEEGSFEVYYQPTYHMNKKLHGAEALLRMHDKKLGMIFPDEFIPIAEQLGLIDELDEFVLHEVCKFVLTGIPQKYGMDCINMNLSVLECMKDGFAEHVSGIVETAGIRKRFINFEITESVASTDYSHLSSVIERLKQEGFLFSIDDYGTGYSNMTALFSLGADVIKIDKSVLWNAEKSALGMTLLKTSIEMVHEMEKKCLMEGVETEEHIRILEELGCDYLQGYYFSKPLPQAELTALLERTA